MIQAMKQMCSAAVMFVITASAVPADGIFDWLFSSGKPITAEITLDNRCKVKSDYFVVRDLDTGAYAKFFRDKASLDTKSGSPIQLQLSPSIKHVFYEGVAVSARKTMKIKADCTTRSIGGVVPSSKNPFLKSD